MSDRRILYGLLLFGVSVVLIFIIFKIFFYKTPQKILSSLGFHVSLRDTTFRGHASEKISGEKNGSQVIVQIVKNVDKKTSINIVNELLDPVKSVQKKTIIIDPYTGKEKSLGVPDKLKPIKGELRKGGEIINYYLVNTNTILSLKIFSDSEVKNRGVFSVFYCPWAAKAYRVEIYEPYNKFDKDKALSMLQSLYCR